MRILTFGASVLALALSAPLGAAPAPAKATAAVKNQDAAITKFFEDYDAAQLARSPVGKSFRAIKDADYAKWDDYSEAEALRRQQSDQAALKDMRKRFAPAKLNPENRLSFRLFEKMIERRSAAVAYRDTAMPLIR